ncbi:pilin [Patescibacteria group bacterium]|nr:pilin [Patescibacteria group bacterium]MBU1673160.1 pilin [Patescibacteria group bacterium]MBU1964155.1 pilin [Patescibacteria group bacterium]
MNKHLFLFVILLFVVLGILSAQGVFAYKLEVPIGTTTEVTDLPQYITIVYRFAIGVISLLAVLMIVFGGFNWITAAGNEQRIGDAKSTIIAAIVGLIIALTSYTLLNTINPNLVSMRLTVPSITASSTGTGGTGGTTTIGTGDGTCEPCPEDSVCGVANLKAIGFDDAGAEALNQICRLESSCGNALISGTDYCIEELPPPWDVSDSTRNAPKADREAVSVSFGPLQVNIASAGVMNSAGTQECREAFSDYASFGQGSSGEWGVHCNIIDTTLYNNCKQHYMDPTSNLQEAFRKYSNGGLQHWGYSANKCGF